jgi:hypothetical protein
MNEKSGGRVIDCVKGYFVRFYDLIVADEKGEKLVT